MTAVQKTIIVSPSGNYYGSEQVLHDFLKNTENQYIVFVPQNSKFEHLLRSDEKHDIRGFKNEKGLYILLFFLLAFKGFKGIYVNEGGHIKYVKLLSKILPNRYIILHLRMLVDTAKSRIGAIKSNVRLITVSNYLANMLEHQSMCIYDPYQFGDNVHDRTQSEKIKIGIIGRISISKGLDKFYEFYNFLEDQYKFEFHFYGEKVINEENNKLFEQLKKSTNVFFHGFCKKEEIYSSIDAVIHLNNEEALGRIVFEAVDHVIPIYTCTQGGTGELMNAIGLTNNLFDYSNDWKRELLKHLVEPTDIGMLKRAKNIAKNNFSVLQYTTSLETVFNS